MKKLLLINGVLLTAGLLWFAAVNYRSSVPLAEASLQGVALSLAAGVQNAAIHEPELQSLSSLRPNDLAFLSVVDSRGIIRFHSNPDLIGAETGDLRHLNILRTEEPLQGRVVLGTGETAYEHISPLHLPDETVALHLTLHTYRADAAVRQAKFNLAILLSLIVIGWVLSFIIYRFAAREERHQRELAQRENLARLGEMGATLAHEIRNPLSGIKGFAQLIEEAPADLNNEAFARRIVNEAIRLEYLVNDLLSFARTDTSDRCALDVKELVEGAVSLISMEAEKRNLTVENQVQAGLRLYGNRDRLGQVLLNLLTNSLQAIESTGKISIDAGRSGKNVVITVTDNGKGIEREHMKKVYEPFFTTKAKGTGLGLSLCRKVIEEHRGQMEIESAPGKGTSIMLHLPGTAPGQPMDHI